jgi:hypothetical protein
MSSFRARLTAIALAVVVALGIGVKALRNGIDEGIRGGSGIGHAGDDIPISGTEIPGGAIGGVGSVGAESANPAIRLTARDVLCDAMMSLADPESPGEVTFDELASFVASAVSERLIRADVFAIENVTDQMMAAANIGYSVNPATAQAYLRSCPPLP